MNAVFVGSGAISFRHLRNWREVFPGADVSLVSRARPSCLERGVTYCSRLDEALETGPACVFISSPSPLHLDATERALRAGAHVFCEKPLSHQSEGVDRLLDLAESMQRVFFVGYNLRHHVCLGEMKRSVDAGEIGTQLSYFIEVGQFLPDWRPDLDYRSSVSAQASLGGGALLELSHEIDLALFLAGCPVEAVHAKCGRVSDLEINVEDYASIRLGFEGRLAAMIHVDFLQRPGHRRYRLLGSRGSLDWDSSVDEVTFTDYHTGKSDLRCFPEAADRNHSYLLQMEAFVAQTKNGPFVSRAAREAASVVEVIEACRTSEEI